jgi:hypothetical protein
VIQFHGFTGVQSAAAPHSCYSAFCMFYSSVSSDQTCPSFEIVKRDSVFIISGLNLVFCAGTSLDKELVSPMFPQSPSLSFWECWIKASRVLWLIRCSYWPASQNWWQTKRSKRHSLDKAWHESWGRSGSESAMRFDYSLSPDTVDGESCRLKNWWERMWPWECDYMRQCLLFSHLSVRSADRRLSIQGTAGLVSSFDEHLFETWFKSNNNRMFFVTLFHCWRTMKMESFYSWDKKIGSTKNNVRPNRDDSDHVVQFCDATIE